MLTHISIATFSQALPECILAIAILALLLIGVFLKNNKKYDIIYSLSILILGIVAYVIFTLPTNPQIIFSGFYISDPFGSFSKICIILGTIYALLSARSGFFDAGFTKFEFPILILSTTLGLLLICSTNDFLTLFMSLELVNLSLYIILAMKSNNIHSTEASLKYFILSCLATGIILYGVSWIYGYAGSTNFEILERFLMNKQPESHWYIMIGFIFVLMGLSFKISAAPFHSWAPDVYEGISFPILVYFSTIPKFAIFTVLLRLTTGPLSVFHKYWGLLIGAIAFVSLCVGAIATLTQKSIKRFMAYSSIGQIGFVLIGISLGVERGYNNTMIFLVYYLISLLGVMSGLQLLSKKPTRTLSIQDLAGLGKSHPILASCLAFFILSLAGLPPLPGFMPKFLLLQAMVQQEQYFLCITAVLYSVLAAAYYLNLIKIIFIDSPSEKQMNLDQVKIQKKEIALLIGAALLLSSLAIIPNKFMQHIDQIISLLVYF